MNIIEVVTNFIISQISQTIDEGNTPTLEQLDALVEDYFLNLEGVSLSKEDKQLIIFKVREQIDLETPVGPVINSKNIKYEKISEEQLSFFKDKESQNS